MGLYFAPLVASTINAINGLLAGHPFHLSLGLFVSGLAGVAYSSALILFESMVPPDFAKARNAIDFLTHRTAKAQHYAKWTAQVAKAVENVAKIRAGYTAMREDVLMSYRPRIVEKFGSQSDGVISIIQQYSVVPVPSLFDIFDEALAEDKTLDVNREAPARRAVITVLLATAVGLMLVAPLLAFKELIQAFL